MSVPDMSAMARPVTFSPRPSSPPLPSSQPHVLAASIDVVAPDAARARERFVPVTTYALVDRLTVPQAWPAGQARLARRFFRYLDY